MTKKTKKPSKKDLEDWKSVADTVNPLDETKKVEISEEESHAPKDYHIDEPITRIEEEDLVNLLKQSRNLVVPHKKMSYMKPGESAGVDGNLSRKLVEGKLPIEATLDMHGMFRDQARDSLKSFINNAYDTGKRCVLVITGKGGRVLDSGVLKELTPKWLNDSGTREKILMFSYAKARHGREGALYILIRRKR